MRKMIAIPFKALRRLLVIICGVVIGISIDLTDRWGLLYWPFASEALGLVPFTFGWQLRYEIYRRLGICCGDQTVLHHGTTIGDRRTTIGSDVWASRDVYIEYAHIGDHVLIGPGAILLAGRHHHRAEDIEQPIKLQGNNPLEPINVGEGAWIGANATVMADLGPHAIVGAGSVVIKSVPGYAVVAGNPARLIRDRRQSSSSSVLTQDLPTNNLHDAGLEHAQLVSSSD